MPSTVLFHEIEGETVLLDTETGLYFGLDQVGTRMWLLLKEHGNVGAAYRQLLQEYDVAPEQLEADLVRFVQTLASRRLLRLQGETERPPEAP